MSCKHLLGLCKVKDCKECSFLGREDECPIAHMDAENERAPTFAQMIDAYKSLDNSYKHVENVLSHIRLSLHEVGLTADDKCTLMTRTRFKILIERLQNPMRVGGPLRDMTIRDYLSSFQAISSRKLEDKYEEMGFVPPKFSVPRFEVKNVPVQEVSERQVRQIIVQMDCWYASGKACDRSAYIYMFFGLFCGMRAGDICRAKWDIIKQTAIGMMVVYVPNKTKKKKDNKVSFPLDARTYFMIEPLIGAPDEYVIPRDERRARGKSKIKKRRYIGLHMSIRNRVNKFLSSIGIGNDYRGQKKFHAMRKFFETDQAMKVGNRVAAQYCGHTEAVQKQSYLGTTYGKFV